MRRRQALLIAGAGVLFVGVAVGTFTLLKNVTNKANGISNDQSILDRKTLARLPEKSASAANLTRLASDVMPPTNSWISGLVLQDTPLAVYPMPLSFQASDTGFQVGLPTVTSAAEVITGGHSPGIEASLKDATIYQLTRFDKTSATLTYRQQDNDIGTVTITQGSPYVFYRAIRDSQIVINNAGGGKLTDNSYSYEKNGKRYVIHGHDETSLKLDGASVSVTIPKESLLTMYALPDNKTDDVLKEFSGNEITSVKVNNELTATQSFTHFEYKTKNNQPTAVSTMPYQTTKDAHTIGVTYQSIYGDMNTYKGSSFTISAPLITPDNELDVSSLSNEEKNAVRTDLKNDSQNISIEPQDTYFAGKQLARVANLLSIAKQLGENEISASLQKVLKEQLTKRLSGSYLYYDSELKGVAAQTAAFGSEDFNDHHFHYGYFIYAASILGKYDKEFLNEHKNEVNLLVADIASYENYKEFPLLRNYDPYSGHGWAAGLAPFQDGNNQESSSEALNAWNAVAVWGDLIGNNTLKETGQWMLSHETATAAKAWRNVDTSDKYVAAYTSPLASLSFGGKRTYATFFSDESNTKLGIQLIPMSPVMDVFALDGDAITTKLAAQDKPDEYNVALGDYLIMYLALKDKPAAIDALNRQKDEFIDDGNSRTYIRAWVASRD